MSCGSQPDKRRLLILSVALVIVMLGAGASVTAARRPPFDVALSAIL
jgi:hypothetical protein